MRTIYGIITILIFSILASQNLTWTAVAPPETMEPPQDMPIYTAPTIKYDIPKPIIVTQDVTNTSCVEMGSDYWRAYVADMDATESEKQWLINTAMCESRLSNCAYSGFYCGIMQYSPITFANAGGVNIWDGAEQLRLALNYYRYRGTNAWPVCGN